MQFLTLDEYLSDARKIMAAQQCGFLIHDEDAVSYVAYRMMVADQSYDGTSKPSTWRYNQAKYAIMRLIDKRKKKGKNKVLSLDQGWKEKELDEESAVMPLVEKVAQKNHEAIYEKFTTVCDHAKNLLNEREYTCFIGYYRDHKTMQTIADELGVSKQRVNQHLTSVIGRLKQCLSKQDL